MTFVTNLECIECGETYEKEGIHYLCSNCGGNLEINYDYSAAAEEWHRYEAKKGNELSLWRYAPLLPVEPIQFGGLNVGWTPLIESVRLKELLGMPNLSLKDDSKNPTASLKDRATAIALARSLENGAEVITCASTGNAASSLAGLGASIGATVKIFVPENASRAKVAQMLLYGAEVFKVKGSYDDAFDLCIKATEKFGWYNRSSGFNPYLSEGKKTVAYEICEQLMWNPPDAIIVPVGDGCIIGGVHKGLKDLIEIGVISEMPRLIAVQADGANSIVKAFESGEEIGTTSGKTIADGIAVGRPREGVKALRAVNETNGYALSVSDEEILEAVRTLTETAGVFVEPSAAATLAGLNKMLSSSLLSKSDRVVLLLTGHGLKAPEAAIGDLKTMTIEPDISDVEKVLEG